MQIVSMLYSSLAALTLTTATLAQAPAPMPDPRAMTLIINEGGPAWRQGKPPQEQDLAAHFAYVGGLFAKGEIVAWGTQTDAVKGYYLLDTADAGAVQQFINDDPAIKSGVLKHAETLGWSVLINAFAPNKADEHYFLLRYAPGPRWIAGKSLGEQDVAKHLAYIGEQTKGGIVVAGGPVSPGDGGLYVIRAADVGAAEAFTAADPGVTSGVFAPQALGWNVVGMQSTR